MDLKVEKYMRILYPNYDQEYTEPTEKFKRDQALVEENIGTIETYCQNGETLVGSGQRSERDIVEQAINDIKTDKYFAIIHPTNSAQTMKENAVIRRDFLFIAKNIDAIDEIYNNSIGENNSGTQVLESIMKKIKSNNYFHMLYPQFDSLTTGEKIAAMEVSAFLDENIDQIDEFYNDVMDVASERPDTPKTPEEVLQFAITSIKIERFLDILHSDDGAKETDEISIGNERAFIKSHLQEIETQYQILMKKEDITEKEAIKRTIEEMKERNNDKVNIRNVLQVATQKDGITNEDIMAAERATGEPEKEGVTKDG